MKKAVIEIGTNSVKLVLGESAAGGSARIIYDVNAITKLGEGMAKSGALSEAAIERSALAVGKFAQFARLEGAVDIACVGTMALRTASNAGDFDRRCYAESALHARVLTGEEEADLSSAAMISSIPGASSGSVLAFDTGGGSTEFISVEDGRRTRAFSAPLGAVTLTDEFLSAPTADPQKVCALIADITKGLASSGVKSGAHMVIGTGGNVTAMAAVSMKMEKYDSAIIHGSTLSREEVMRQIALYAKSSPEERRRIPGLSPLRADIILGGACIILAAMDAAGVQEITVSDKSLRHELLRQMFTKNN